MVGFCLRQLLMDKLTLNDYEQNVAVSWCDIKRRLMLEERTVNYHISDNHLYAALDSYDIESLDEVFTKGFPALSEQFLTTEGSKIYVAKERFALWQELLTFCPPLILTTAYIWNKNMPSGVGYSAILPPYIKELEDIMHENKGFNDMHMHLNGSTETDVLWQDILNNPNEFRRYYRAAYRNSYSYVVEQIEQENVFQDSNHLYALLQKARALRYYMVTRFIKNDFSLSYPHSGATVYAYTVNLIRGEHPYAKGENHLDLEQQMYVAILSKIRDSDKIEKALLSQAFHHYLLILGTINRFVVQQVHQNGFQQFQKITQNEFRTLSENTYKKRFFQLCGNGTSPNFHVLEGRFAPKKTPADLDCLIGKIRKGWQGFKKSGHDAQQLHLVCHFIKQRGSSKDFFRHEKLRNQLWVQAHVIIALKGDSHWMSHPDEDVRTKLFKLVGVDAAASEFDAPPEVFAPAFRFLRCYGEEEHAIFKNITFHAGEDFFHILSGLRSIFESVIFFDMIKGDRIGHATALGILPQLWQDRIGDTLYMSRGEWMDNLVFCLSFLELQPCQLRADIEKEIEDYFNDIYPHTDYSIEDLIEAWKYRKWDPEVLLGESLSEIPSSKQEEWDAMLSISVSDNVRKLIAAYHTHREAYDKKILVDFDIITSEVIVRVQQKLMCLISQKEIILETLPTSNVRISIYKGYHEHHLKKWLNENVLLSVPKVVVGSDDTGIFATNIYNEYAHVYMMYGRNQEDIIKLLIANANESTFVD